MTEENSGSIMNQGNIKIHLKRDKETGQYRITKGHNSKKNKQNSILYMTKKKAYNCVYPSYIQQNGQYKTRGITNLEIPGKQTKGSTRILQPLNLTFTEPWGVSFYIMRENKGASLIPWREPRKYRKDSIKQFKIYIYGPNNQTFKTQEKLSGNKIKIPMRNLPQKTILKYKIQIGPCNSKP